MFYNGIDAFDPLQNKAAARANQVVQETRSDVVELSRRVERLALLNQALWELMRDKLGLTDAELEKLAQEIDLRDGVADGRITATAVRCPNCGRVNSSRHKRCMYCSTEFESMAFE